jgi:hypothetical protein
MTQNGDEWKGCYRCTARQVEQHVEGEETRIFPEAAEVLATHWEKITVLLQERKAQILAS